MSIANRSNNILASPIEYLKGVGPQRAELLKKELGIFTFQDLLEHYPYRHVDRTKINLIRDIRPDMEFVQVVGKVVSSDVVGDRRTRRLVVELRDATGVLQLVWFQGVMGMQKLVQVGGEYLVFGRLSYYQGSPQLTHPEVEAEGRGGGAAGVPGAGVSEHGKAKGEGAWWAAAGEVDARRLLI